MKPKTQGNHHNAWGWIALLYILFWLLIAPLLQTHNPRIASAGQELTPPSSTHLLGTDRLGRDVWSRLAVGGSLTLGTALLATTLSISAGLLLALCNIPPLLSTASKLLTDALLAFPGVLIALVVRTIISGEWYALGIAVGIAHIAPYAYTATVALQVAAAAPHIEGAQSIGASRWRILTRHQLPHALPTLAAFGAVIFAWSILYAAALSFLGLGESPSTPEWGTMLAQGQGVLIQTPRLVLLPSMLIALSVWLAYRVADTITAAPSK